MFLTFPSLIVLLIFKARSKKRNNIRLSQTVDGRLIEILEEPYKERFYWWEAWRLVERFIVSGIAVFLTNPIYRILYLIPVFVFFANFHFRMNPYNNSMYVLKRLDNFSWLCLFIHLGTNGMRAVAYIYDVPNVASISYALKAADVLEELFSPLWYLVISFVKKKILEKFLIATFLECF